MNPLTFATKKHSPSTHTHVYRRQRERAERKCGMMKTVKQQQKTIYYLLHRCISYALVVGIYHVYCSHCFILPLESLHQRKCMSMCSKTLNAATNNRVKREQTANYSNFLHENYSSTNTHSFCIECCLKCVVQSLVMDFNGASSI